MWTVTSQPQHLIIPLSSYLNFMDTRLCAQNDYSKWKFRIELSEANVANNNHTLYCLLTGVGPPGVFLYLSPRFDLIT